MGGPEDPSPPYIETAEELERVLRHPKMGLWRFLWHGWWTIASLPPMVDDDNGPQWCVGRGVIVPAVTEWHRMHGLALPAADAECIFIQHPNTGGRHAT